MSIDGLRSALVYLAYVVSFTYLLALGYLTTRAERYAVNPRRFPRPDDILRPHLFTQEGQVHRRRAIRFLVIGAGIVCLSWGLTFL